MKKSLLPILFFFLGFFLNNRLLAFTPEGGEITYSWVSGSRYAIQLVLFRDCRGTPLSTIPKITLNGRKGTSKIVLSYTPTRRSIVNISNVCRKDFAGRCNPGNTTVSSEGKEKHIFIDTVDFGKAPYDTFQKNGYCQMDIYTNVCCRSSGVINCGVGGTEMYLNAYLDLCLSAFSKKVNSSPVFGFDPVFFPMVNQPYRVNHAALDNRDRDSLVYSLVCPSTSAPASGSYVCPFGCPSSAYQIPVTPYCIGGAGSCTANPNANPPQGFFLDPITGSFVVTPVTASQLGVIALQVAEYRRDTAGAMRLIGRVTREYQYQTLSGYTNNPPVLTFNSVWTICEGDKLTFGIKTTDKPFTPGQSLADTVLVKWISGLPGADIYIKDTTAREKEIMVSWQTKMGDASTMPYFLYVEASDNYCDRRAYNQAAIRITVKKRAKAKPRKYTVTACGYLKMEAEPEENSVGSPSYKWEMLDSQFTKLPFVGYRQRDTFRYTTPGKYYVWFTLNNGNNCPTQYMDTVYLKAPATLRLNAPADTLLCVNSKLDVSLKDTLGTGKLKSFRWSRNGKLDARDTLTGITHIQKSDTSMLLKLFAYAENGCVYEAQTNVKGSRNPLVNLGPDRRVCSNGQIIASAAGQNGVKYRWIPGNDSTVSKTLSTAGMHILQAVNASGCASADTLMLYKNAPVKVDIGPDRVLCAGETLGIIPRTSAATSANDSVFVWLLSNPMIYRMARNWSEIASNSASLECTARFREDTTWCENSDTISIKVNPLPALSFTPAPHVCHDAAPVDLLTVTKPNRSDVVYSSAIAKLVQLNSGRYELQPAVLSNTSTGYWVYLKVTDSLTGCIRRDSFLQSVYRSPRPALGNDTAIRAGDSLLVNNSGDDGRKLWHDNSTGGTFLFRSAGKTPGNYRVWLRITDSTSYCEGSDTLQITVQQPQGISSGKPQQFLVYPNPAQQQIMVLNKDGGSFRVWLCDAAGKTVILPVQSQKQLQLDIRHLARGLYLLQTESASGRSSIPLILE